MRIACSRVSNASILAKMFKVSASGVKLIRASIAIGFLWSQFHLLEAAVIAVPAVAAAAAAAHLVPCTVLMFKFDETRHSLIGSSGRQLSIPMATF